MKYRKLPVVIEAVKFEDTVESLTELSEFTSSTLEQIVVDYADKENPVIYIPTLEGTMKASVGDYIIKGVKGELYPCKPDIFERTYEVVGSEDRGKVAYVVGTQSPLYHTHINYQVFSSVEGANACREFLKSMGEKPSVQTLPFDVNYKGEN